MTTQEQQLIDELVDRIRNTNVQNKDADAESHLKQGLSGSPDALYILAQTVIVQKYGLEQAQQRLQSMQSELDSLREQAAQSSAKPSGGSFLSHIFGGFQPSAPVQPPATPSGGSWQPVTNPGYPQAPVAPPAYPTQSYGQPSGWGAGPMGGGGGFLQGALQTAAGVAMGEMAFQSVESLFRGFGGGGGYGHGFEGDRPSETIINNYNDRDEPRRQGLEDSSGREDSSFYNPHDDASRANDSGSNFANTDQNSGTGTNNNDFAGDSNDSDDTGSDNGADDSSFDGGSDDSGFGGDDSNY